LQHSFYVFFFLRFYLFTHESQRKAEAEGEAGSPPGRELRAGLEPKTWDHELSRRQTKLLILNLECGREKYFTLKN